jgi:hypothetical protein
MSHRELSDNKPESQFPEPRKHSLIENPQVAVGALRVVAALTVVSLLACHFAQESAAPKDKAPHKVRSINVDTNGQSRGAGLGRLRKNIGAAGGPRSHRSRI